jgi:photosystem II stability/assembly factor-like uncharacterized protein
MEQSQVSQGAVMERMGFASRFLGSCAVAALMTLLAACGGGGDGGEVTPPPVQPVSLTIAGLPSASLLPGQSAQLTATLTYSDSSTKDVTHTANWSTSNAAVLLVSSAGTIAAVAPGQAEVSASTPGLAARGTVTVAAPTAPAFTAQPADQSVTVSRVANFTSTVSGVPTPTLQWQQSADDGVTWTDIAGATAASYSVRAGSTDNGGRYRLVATNSVASAISDAAALYVNPSTTGLTCTGPNGSGWCQIGPPQANTLHAVTRVHASTLVAVGQGGTILRSVDGGLTWTAVPSGTGVALNGVAFAGPSLGIAVGENGTILRTVDGGLTWSAAASGTGLPLAAVAFAGGESAAFAVGSDSVFRSTDGGQVWSLASQHSVCTSGTACSPYAFTGIAFADASTAVAVGAYGRAIRSTDGGATWTDAAMINYGPMKAVAFAGPGFGVAVGGGCAPIVETSNDAGQSWILRSEEGVVILCPPRGYFAISLPTARLGFVVGTFTEAIMRTVDGGASWAPTAPSGTRANLLGVAFINPTTGVAVGQDGVILLTSTSGI